MHYDIIVVGAGIAGLTASAFLAKSGHSVLLLEKDEKVGGMSLFLTAVSEPSKTLVFYFLCLSS